MVGSHRRLGLSSDPIVVMTSILREVDLHLRAHNILMIGMVGVQSLHSSCLMTWAGTHLLTR